MKISTSALAGVLTAAALSFGATASDASITFAIKDFANQVNDAVETFAPESVFGTDFGVSTSGGVGGTFSIVGPGSVGSQFRSPWDGTGMASAPGATYFSVGGQNEPSPQAVTFGTALTGLTMLLGSLDSYNSFTFNEGDVDETTITGSDIAVALGFAPNGGNYAVNVLLRFQGINNSTINSMKVTSTQAAAEFAVAAVPLPAAGFLMLAGLGGLVASRKLRRRVDA